MQGRSSRTRDAVWISSSAQPKSRAASSRPPKWAEDSMASRGRIRLPDPRLMSRTASVSSLGAESGGGSSFLRRRSTWIRRAADLSAKSMLRVGLLSRRTLTVVIASPLPPAAEDLQIRRSGANGRTAALSIGAKTYLPHWVPTRLSAQPRRCLGPSRAQHCSVAPYRKRRLELANWANPQETKRDASFSGDDGVV